LAIVIGENRDARSPVLIEMRKASGRDGRLLNGWLLNGGLLRPSANARNQHQPDQRAIRSLVRYSKHVISLHDAKKVRR
jgi:hypothetical protein